MTDQGGNRELGPIDQLIGPTLRRLGIGDLSVMTRLTDEWDVLAGSPWAGASRPLIIRNRELVVESTTPAATRMLRYAAESLAKRLSDQFGDGVIDSVRVVAPSR